MTEPAAAMYLPTGCHEPLEAWEGRGVADLAHEWAVPRVVACASVGSTNDLAFELARSGCASGTCVLAEAQTAGRGRHARPWSSPAGLGIWLSLVIRPPPGADPGVVPLLTGLAVARALDPFCAPAAPQVKWPNDVLVGGAKIAGILCEATWEADRLAFMVAGIGVNVHQGADQFAPEIRGLATSVHLVSGTRPARAAVAGAVVRSVLLALAAPTLSGGALDELRRRDALNGRRVAVEGAGPEVVFGLADGIDEHGSLRIRTADGAVRAVRSGTVRLVDPPVPHAATDPAATAHPRK